MDGPNKWTVNVDFEVLSYINVIMNVTSLLSQELCKILILTLSFPKPNQLVSMHNPNQSVTILELCHVVKVQSLAIDLFCRVGMRRCCRLKRVCRGERASFTCRHFTAGTTMIFHQLQLHLFMLLSTSQCQRPRSGLITGHHPDQGQKTSFMQRIISHSPPRPSFLPHFKESLPCASHIHVFTTPLI